MASTDFDALPKKSLTPFFSHCVFINNKIAEEFRLSEKLVFSNFLL